MLQPRHIVKLFGRPPGCPLKIRSEDEKRLILESTMENYRWASMSGARKDYLVRHRVRRAGYRKELTLLPRFKQHAQIDACSNA